MQSGILRQFRYGARSLRKSPGLTVAAIATLALGIGANTAIFSVLEGVVLRPLPYHDPGRLVLVLLYNRTLKYATWTSYPDFLDWQRTSRSFDQIAAFMSQGYDLSSPGTPAHVDALRVSSNFFDTLGVKPALGRDLSPADDRIAAVPAAILSHAFWRERFSASPAALGKTLTLDGVAFTIVGVLPPGFRFDQDAAVYTAIGRSDPIYQNDRTVHNLACVGRLATGVSLGQARAEMNAVQDRIDQQNPATERGLGAWVVLLKDSFVGDLGRTLLLLLGAVGLVLLIACANVANLMLARSAARTREFAVRLALGASRAHILRQLISESLLLSLSGGLLGLAVAALSLKAVLVAAPADVPRIENIGLNGPVLLFALAVSIAVGIAFGLLPAFKTSGLDIHTGLREAGRGISGGHHRTQRALVVAEIALALVLLTGGGMLFRSIRNLWTVNPGFDPHRVITFQVGLSPSTTNAPARIRAAHQELVSRIRRVPGVLDADITALVPLGKGANEGPFWIGSKQPASMAEIPRAVYYPVGPDYLDTMRIPLLRGRFLTATDTVNSERVVVVDSLLARTYFGSGDALGRTLTIPHWGAALNVGARIVGVTGHVEQYRLDGSAGQKPQIYFSYYQLPDEALPVFRGEVAIAVRTRLDASAVMPAIRTAVWATGSDQPVYNVQTIDQLVSGSLDRQRFPMLLLTAFAALALLLSLIGIYGVISYSLSRRLHEIGVRMALGARRRDVLRLVLGQGFRLALLGVILGAAAAIILTRVLSSFSSLLYGVAAADPLTLVPASFLLISTSLLACFLPARRAARSDPMAALRQE